jgi:hypothetical protein
MSVEGMSVAGMGVEEEGVELSSSELSHARAEKRMVNLDIVSSLGDKRFKGVCLLGLL